MTEPKRKRGRPRQFETLVSLPMYVTPALRDWFESLPGTSRRERMEWLQEQVTGGPAPNPTLDKP